MLKKILIPIIALLPISGFIKGAESTIESVTVYRQGARITRTASISLKAGSQEVIIGNLTSSIDANSLQVALKGNAVLLSASVRQNFVGYQTLPERQKSLKDSLELITDQITWMQHELELLKGEEALILANQDITNDKVKVTAADVAALADFYKTRLTSIRKDVYKTNIELRRAKETKQKIEKQLQELNYRNGQQMGEVVLNISATQATRVVVELSYLSHDAGWQPVYDIRCLGTQSPLDLVYKANVSQNTGYDWSGVDLTISTGNPSANNNRPILNPWYINFASPVQIRGAASMEKSAAAPRAAMNMLMVMEDEVALDEDFAPPVPYKVVESNNQMTSEYAIKVKQDIPSDGKEHIVPIRNLEVPAVYSYHTVPKLSQHAYLLARVGNYGQYDLLPGQTNIFFEGMYVGQTYLNPEVTGDSLILSMGRDDRINIQRNQITDLTAVRTIGANKKVERAYEIIIRNNKKETILLEVLDQVPIAQNKDIEVEIEEMQGADYNETYGKLTWRIEVRPAETKKIRLVYSVKYPKDQQVPGL